MSVLPTDRSVHAGARPAARRQHRAAQPVRERTIDGIADAFLNHCFEPIYLTPAYPSSDDYAQRVAVEAAESEFFGSLQHVAALYDWTEVNTGPGLPYPHNIGWALQAARQRLRATDPALQLIIVADDHHRATLATVWSSTGDYAFTYIPVRPYWNLFRSRARRDRKRLITSVYAYLYRIVQIPYCTTDSRGSFIGYQHEMCAEEYYDVNEDGDEVPGSDQSVKTYLKGIDQKAKRARRYFDSPRWLDQFGPALEAFRPKCEADDNLLGAANRLFKLYQAYPDAHIHVVNDMHLDVANPREANYLPEPPISVEQYLSFIWTDDDELYQWIEQAIQCDFENGSEQEPLYAAQLFDKPQPSVLNHSPFYDELFDALMDFLRYIWQLDHDQRQSRLSEIAPA